MKASTLQQPMGRPHESVSSAENISHLVPIPIPPSPSPLPSFKPLYRQRSRTTELTKEHTYTLNPPYRRNHVSGNRCGVDPAGGLQNSHALTALAQPNETFNRLSAILSLRLLPSIARHSAFEVQPKLSQVALLGLIDPRRVVVCAHPRPNGNPPSIPEYTPLPTMSRKMTRNNYIPASAAPNPFPIDRPSGRGQKHQASGYRQSKHQSSGQGQSKRNQTQLDRPRNAFTDSDKANQNEGDETGRSSARSSSSDEDADAEVSNTDAVEADEEEDEDANGDALAPSGCAMNKHGNQAGRIKLVFKKGALLSRKRKASSAGLESAAQTTKHVRSTSRNTTSHDEASDSDDEAYNAVDLVSEDESDVEEFEEKNIINAEDGKEDMPAFPDENTAETSDGWEGFDIDNNLILPDVPYFDEQYERIESGILGSEIEHFQLASLIDDLEGPTSLGLSSTRRVRFKDQMPPPSDSSDIVSNDEDLYGLFNTTEIPVQSSKNVTFNFDDVDDVYAGGNSSGYESGFLYLNLICEANVAFPQLIMARPPMKRSPRCGQSPSIAGHRCLQLSTPPQMHQQRPVLSRYLPLQLDISQVRVWVRGRSTVQSHAL